MCSTQSLHHGLVNKYERDFMTAYKHSLYEKFNVWLQLTVLQLIKNFNSTSFHPFFNINVEMYELFYLLINLVLKALISLHNYTSALTALCMIILLLYFPLPGLTDLCKTNEI